MSKKFNEIDKSYRVRIDSLCNTKSWLSKKSFKKYEDAFEYGKKESEKFEPCSWYIELIELPKVELDFNIIPSNDLTLPSALYPEDKYAKCKN